MSGVPGRAGEGSLEREPGLLGKHSPLLSLQLTCGTPGHRMLWWHLKVKGAGPLRGFGESWGGKVHRITPYNALQVTLHITMLYTHLLLTYTFTHTLLYLMSTLQSVQPHTLLCFTYTLLHLTSHATLLHLTLAKLPRGLLYFTQTLLYAVSGV